jgi:NADPH:quinone reductase-like Zn-dependent oxidoreductase
VTARLGLYQDAPPLPSILGYDVTGRIAAVGAHVHGLMPGQRVTALTRFGGYAEYAVADSRGLAVIPEEMEAGVALALSTQYCTAYMLSEEMAGLQAGDHVLIHAAAGGVGTALVQLAKYRNCKIFGTAGSRQKLEYLHDIGVHYPINYREEDFEQAVRAIIGDQGLDAIFDPIGGKSVAKGVRLLGAGGRILCFGGSSLTQARNLPAKIRVALGFGFYSPISLLKKSCGIIGLNMLRIAEQRPDRLARVMETVVGMAQKGILAPNVGGVYPATDIAEAHRFLESRLSMGKIALIW